MSPHKQMAVTSDQREKKKITHAQVSLGLCTKFEVEEGKETGHCKQKKQNVIYRELTPEKNAVSYDIAWS